ncbi:uncharacterized protein [Procambarus clarkii]|uniref:uncharacterized protein n=1 Tax=Procambarus clarkii TaxID=6728 RepID=UPI0037431E88
MQERLCPPGMVFLPYDLPSAGSGYNLTVQGYTCSSQAWILKQQSLGKTNCRMVLIFNLALYGYDYSDMAGVGPYDWVFQQCLTHPCASVTCSNPGYCWLKYESHITLGASLFPGTFFTWYAYCQ